MRTFLVSGCFAIALLVSSTIAPAAKADHGYRGGGYGASYGGGGYGSGYAAHDCYSHNSGYASYQPTIVPVYPGGIYQSYSFGGAPMGGYSNYGQIGFPNGGAPYSAGFGSGFYGSGYRAAMPRVQLRIGF